MSRFISILFAIIFLILPFPNYIYSIAQAIEFSANCGDYLELSANANNIDVAEKHLTTAINYLEKNGITKGYTKVFVYYPKNDVGLWYENLKTAQLQLQDIKQLEEISELEESNMLMKLREAILDNDGTLTHPMGISIFENFNLIFWLNCLMWLCWILSIILFLYGIEWY